MCLHGGPLGFRTLPTAWDPVFLHLTLHAIQTATIILIRNTWFQEAADILTPGNIIIIVIARRYVVGKSSC